MKTIFCYLLLSLLIGCSSTTSSKNGDDRASTEGCTEQPSLTLKKENVEEISLNERPVNESGQVTSNKSLGYAFKAEAGQKLSYKTDNDICIWVYTPDNEIINSTKLEKAGTYTIQISTIKESTNFDLEMSLENTIDSSSTTSQSIVDSNQSDTSSQSNSDFSTNSNNYNLTSKQVDLTQEQALEIVKGWYRAKPQIFGNSFDRSLVAKYTTGKFYYEKTQKDGGGSIGWLEKNGCYYTYPFSNIDNIWSFSSSGMRPLLKIQVSEELQLHGPSSAGCGKRPHSYQKNVSYWFEKENGTWKIYNYEIE